MALRAALLLLAFAILGANAQLGPGEYTLNITGRPGSYATASVNSLSCAEGVRKFIVYVPKQYSTAAANSVPVVWAWHGAVNAGNRPEPCRLCRLH